jgi:hypothetical protein
MGETLTRPGDKPVTKENFYVMDFSSGAVGFMAVGNDHFLHSWRIHPHFIDHRYCGFAG